MEKYLKIGEKYVQWIALGLGALYLVLMGLFYIAQPPSDLTVELDHKPCLPGELDQQIKRGDLAGIERDIDTKPSWVKPVPPDPVEVLKTAFVDQAPQLIQTALARVYVQPGTHPLTQPSEIAPSILVPPAAEVAAVAPSQGLSELNIPQPTKQPAAVAGGAAPAPVQPVIAQEDHDWITHQWTVSAKLLNDAFQAAHIPDIPNVYQTAFLRVQTVREELLPNGQWGNAVVVPDITTVVLPPLPPETAPANPDKAVFLADAASRASSILTPPFFEVVYGTKWYPPGTPKPDDVFAPLGVPQPVAPVPGAPFPGGVGPGLAPRGEGLPGMPRGVHGNMVPPPAGPYLPRGEGYPPYRPYRPPVSPEMRPAMEGGYARGIINPAGTAGFIDPRQVPDITIYTHDWTLEPGHTYRYKMHYWISNPLFNVEQGKVTPAERTLLAIESPYSAWTAPIQVPSRYKFWVQKFQRNNSNEVVFDLFTKKPSAPGGFEHSTVRVTPGDTIGPSPWLLVDVRQDSARHNSFYFLVANPAGHIERRDLDKDVNDPDHIDMLGKSGATAAAIGVGG